MKVRVQEWGQQLALRIPRSFADQADIGPGSTVEVSLEKGRIIVFPIAEQEFSLDEMLSRITAEKLHSEVDTDGRTGPQAPSPATPVPPA